MIQGLNHITLAVKDIDRSFHFYRDILGFKPLVKWAQGAYFLILDPLHQTEVWFCLNLDPQRAANPCYTHYAFSVSSDNFDQMMENIEKSGAKTFKENKSFGRSFYFLDPDQHKLEIHASNYQERIDHKKIDVGNWKDVEWFV